MGLQLCELRDYMCASNKDLLEEKERWERFQMVHKYPTTLSSITVYW